MSTNLAIENPELIEKQLVEEDTVKSTNVVEEIAYINIEEKNRVFGNISFFNWWLYLKEIIANSGIEIREQSKLLQREDFSQYYTQKLTPQQGFDAYFYFKEFGSIDNDNENNIKNILPTNKKQKRRNLKK